MQVHWDLGVGKVENILFGMRSGHRIDLLSWGTMDDLTNTFCW